jgi:hypothetical protein
MNSHRFDEVRLPRWAWIVLIMLMLPIAFALGRVTGPAFETLREAEAAPVPHALPGDIATFHDASAEITCWRVIGSGGLACLPDQWLASARADAMP